jgi:predicted dienelactone hydrolase
LLTDLAAAGYVVAAPDFPGTSTRSPGSPNRSDLVQQPGDVSFVISSLLDVTTRPGPLFSMIDGNAIGVAGQSDGGVTAAAAAFNTSCLDPRIRAAAILTGGSFGFTGVWFPPGTPPALYVHATADQVNPYAASVSMFTRTQSAKYLVTVTGGSHFEVYVDDPWEDEVVATTVAFYDLHLKGMATAADRLTAVGTSGDLSLEVG